MCPEAHGVLSVTQWQLPAERPVAERSASEPPRPESSSRARGFIQRKPLVASRGLNHAQNVVEPLVPGDPHKINIT
ncbi:hypothetical protein Aduo_014453 [Ancylostoma duodenale]